MFQSADVLEQLDSPKAASPRAVVGALCKLVQAHIARLENSKAGLLEWGVKYFPHYFPLPFGEHHRVIAGELERLRSSRGQRTLIIAPRDAAKSTLSTFLEPLHAVCEQTEQYIMLLGDTYSQAVKYLSSIKAELTENAELEAVYPNACGEGIIWSEDTIITRNGIRIEALGAGQKIRGRKAGEHRPSLIIMDDPEGEEAAYSAPTREHILEWATKAVFKAGSPATNYIVIGTPIHRACLVSQLRTMPGWRQFVFKAIKEWPVNSHLWDEWELLLRENEDQAQQFLDLHREEMHEGAKVLWPERETLEKLMMTRATDGHNAFESEKQCNPVDPSKCEWGPELFEGDVWFDEWPKDPQGVVHALDPSKGRDARNGDYQAHCTMMAKDGVIYVDMKMGHEPVIDMLHSFILRCAAFPQAAVVIEAEQFQELLVSDFERMTKELGLLLSCEPVVNSGIPKNVRIRRLGPFLNRGRVKFKRKSPGVKVAIEQLKDFPNGDHDDGPDAMEMALRVLLENVNAGQLGENWNSSGGFF